MIGNSTFTIVVTGGGTAGHITPLIAVIAGLRKQRPDARIVYIGQKGASQPVRQFLEPLVIESRWIYAGKLHRFLTLKNIFIVLSIVGFWQSLFILIRERPAVIFAKGGFVSLPVGLAAAVLRLPLVIHESDAVLGMTNRILSRFSAVVCVGFPLEEKKFVFTGNPVREIFFGKKTYQEHGQPVLLVTGGSQGAHEINQLIFDHLEELTDFCSVVHLAGSIDFNRAKWLIRPGYLPLEFVSDMAQRMKEADAVISRAGANTLAELAAVGKPALLIPLMGSAHDHQNKNAQFFARRQAALILDDPALFIQVVKRLLFDDNLRATLSENIKKLAMMDAAQLISEYIIKAGRRL